MQVRCPARAHGAPLPVPTSSFWPVESNVQRFVERVVAGAPPGLRETVRAAVTGLAPRLLELECELAFATEPGAGPCLRVDRGPHKGSARALLELMADYTAAADATHGLGLTRARALFGLPPAPYLDPQPPLSRRERATLLVGAAAGLTLLGLLLSVLPPLIDGDTPRAVPSAPRPER